MRVLYLTPFPPRYDAHHGGAQAMAQWIGATAERHEVAVLCFQAEGEPPVDDALLARGVHVEAVPRRGDEGPLPRRIRRALRLGAAPLASVPQWAASVRSRRFASRVRALVAEWRPDVVQAEQHVMGQYTAALGDDGPATVVVVHEPGVHVAEERLARAPAVARPWHRLNVAAWRRFEPAVLGAADAVVAFTEPDARVIRALAPDAEVVQIPLVLALPEAVPAEPEGASPTLLFIGNFEHPPNREAASRLTRAIFPRVRAACPEARLVVVGPGSREHVRRSPGVEATGRVPAVETYLAAASVVVAPLATGGGMRLKVVEAVAAGKAVVASRLAAEGLDLVDGVDVLLADGDDAFAEAVVGLLRDPARRAEIGRNARAWAEAHLCVDRMADAYDALYHRLARPPR